MNTETAAVGRQARTTLRCAVVGDIAVDVLVQPGAHLARGADTRGRVECMPGGSAANVATWMCRLGAAVTCVGTTGRDVWGSWLRRDLRREGVRLIGPVRGRTASIAVLVEPETGERTFVTDRAGALDLRPDDVPVSLVDDLAVLHLPAYSLFEDVVAVTAAHLIQQAHARGVAVSLDFSSASLLADFGADRFVRLVRALQPDIVLATRDEAAALPGTAGQSLMGALASLAPIAILKCGGEGAVGVAAATTSVVHAPAVTVVDTTGAGDAFAAAFLVSYMASKDLDAALRAGVRLASWVVTQPGARPPLPLAPSAGTLDTVADGGRHG